jgi:hypothetical protein
MARLSRDLVGGAAAFLLGGGYLALAMQLSPSARDDSVGAAGLPKILGSAMLVLSVLLLVRAGLAQARAGRAAAPAAADKVGAAPIARQLLRAAGLVAFGIGYLVIVSHSGYLPAIMLLIVAVAAFQGAPLNWRLVAIAVAGALVLWLFFGLLLGIPMPGGAIAHYF